MNRTRNFSIIAHIDHGKSTLADRLLELTGVVSGKRLHEQILDDMDLEQERGITIKAHAVTMNYRDEELGDFTLNLIDTPGHVDFTYEVSRSLASCEGALLIIDATQGIEAQTLSNLYLAIEHDLQIIPIINKIDLPSAQIEETTENVVDLLGCEPDEILEISAKFGQGVPDVLKAIVRRVPAPKGNPDAPLRALIFDSIFDTYRGAIPYVRIFDGKATKGMPIKFMSNDKRYEVEELGILTLKRQSCKELLPGDVGYIIPGCKMIRQTRVGDTITSQKNSAKEALSGFKVIKPMVFAGLYPTNSEDYPDLRDSLEKLALNDAAFTWEPETSIALGFGFRSGFLGMLHMEVVQERLEREHNLDLITTLPSVEYKVTLEDGEVKMIDNPAKMPPISKQVVVEEPFIKAEIITPTDYIGPIMKLGLDRRGVYKNTEYLEGQRVNLQFDFPLAEVIYDFYDRLKSISRGYASLDYDFVGFRSSKMARLDIILNSEIVDALSLIVHQDKAFAWGQRITAKLKKVIPRQLFQVAIQAAVGSKVIARTNVKALRKNVLAKCYGGDITRKRKLLEKQRAGKRRMKQIGSVEIPQEAFLALLQVDDDD
ncbi:elongation factor 4 [candidate division LCP-89 bacterium B3_LCP]|uniref:Elongation factor 4 n=1 Tax=candidate division LCP-89 bacterium B3_LCP TaxID=2012998 RepID=A0A532UZM1_UNCL8|nr:MAG: elongation factor 4 [candidate division LCP-89 bacterium B3_LCP]